MEKLEDNYTVKIENKSLLVEAGTGFFISKQHIITCAHCLKNSDNKPIKVYLNDKSIEFDIVKIDYETDLALLKTKLDHSIKHAVFTERIIKRDKISFYSYHYKLSKFINITGNIQNDNRNDIIVFQGGKVIDGNSGAALLNDENNCIIGLVNISLNKHYPEGGCAIPHNIIRDFCSKNSVELTYRVTEVEQLNKSLVSKLEGSLKSRIKDRVFRRLISIEINERKKKLSFDNLIDNLSRTTLNILFGSGGLGKSILLKRIAINIAESKISNSVNIFCSLSNWKKGDLNTGLQAPRLLRQLLRCFRKNDTEKYISVLESNSLPEDCERILFIDGLNEISKKDERKKIVEALEILKRDYKFGIIATARYYNSDDYKSWQLLEVELIDKNELLEILKDENIDIENFDDRNIEYLSIPYFLNIALVYKDAKIESYSKFIYDHLFRTINRDDRTELLEKLSETAYEAYQSDQPLTIKSINIREDLKEKLLEDGILIETEDGYKYEHQLINDLLVSYKVALNSDLWHKGTLDIMTLENPNLREVIQMTLEQVKTDNDGDKFLLEVYNWNFYSTLHCLKYVNKEQYTDSLARVLILILTEKIYDRFVHTKKKVFEFLEPLYNSFEIKFPGINNLSEYIRSNPNLKDNGTEFYAFIESNKEVFKGSKFEDWYNLFSLKNSNLSEKEIYNVINENPLIGWTCSNVIKRVGLKSSGEMQLRAMYTSLLEKTSNNSESDIYRWRIVHALGVANDNDTIELLLEAVREDSYKWVRYGAIRSLIEIEFFNPKFEKKLVTLNRLVDIFKQTEQDERVIDEFKKCLTTKMPKRKVTIVDSIFKEIIGIEGGNFKYTDEWVKAYQKFKQENGNN